MACRFFRNMFNLQRRVLTAAPTSKPLPDVITVKLLDERPSNDSPEEDHQSHLTVPTGTIKIHETVVNFMLFNIVTEIDIPYQNFWWNNKCKIHLLVHQFHCLENHTLFPIKSLDDTIIFIMFFDQEIRVLYFNEDECELFLIPDIDFLRSSKRNYSTLLRWDGGTVPRHSMAHIASHFGIHVKVERCEVLPDKKKCKAYVHNKIHEKPFIDYERACNEVDAHIDSISDRTWKSITFLEFIISPQGHVKGFSGCYFE